ncbi:MAG: D-2-hydroxyacid dehydrogenase [Vicinamibacterales bacterium]
MARIVYIGAPEADAHSFRELVARDFPDIDLYATDERESAFEHVDDCEALIGHHFQFDQRLLSRAPKLRWIQSLTTGTDAILKIPALRREVLVTSTRGIHGPQMSELVFLAMLSMTRDYPRMLRNQQNRVWQRWPQPLLLDKTAVIVGAGAIAESLAPRCKSFGMTVLGVDSNPRVIEGFDHVHPREELIPVAARADYLILIVPHTAETENMIDGQVLAALKPSAFLINVARGGVLDEAALMAALSSGRLAGAALDVFRETPLPEHSALWSQPRLMITPLIGGMSNVYLRQCYPVVRANLGEFLAGRPAGLKNIVEH